LSPRNFALPLVAAGVVALLVYLRPAPEAAPTPPSDGGPGPLSGEEAPPKPFAFLHSLPIQAPPPNALRTRIPAENPADRWFDRLLWATPRIVFDTQEKVASLTLDEQRHFVERFRTEFHRDAGRAAVAVTCLGAFEIQEAHDLLLEAAVHSNNRVRSEAARALALKDSAAAAERTAQLLEDPVEAVRRAALRSLTEMDCPEATAALVSFAEQNPDEGIRHALAKLGRDAEDPSVIPVLRQHMDRPDDGRYHALDGLARFGDGNALDRLYELIGHPDSGVVKRALQSLHVTPPELLQVEKLEFLVTHKYPEVRSLCSVLLSKMALAEGVEDRERVLELLVRQSADLDMRVRRPAFRGLFLAGRTDIAEPFLRVIPTATGYQLNTTLDVLTFEMEDERAVPLILARLDHVNSPNDISMLILGLANIADPSTSDVVLQFLRDANPDEPRDGNGHPLSQTATLHLAKFGAEIQDALLEIAEDDDLHDQARMRAFDALRALPEADCIGRILALAQDEDLSLALRAAAIETLPHLEGDLYSSLSTGIEEIEHVELARLAQIVLYNYS